MPKNPVTCGIFDSTCSEDNVPAATSSPVPETLVHSTLAAHWEPLLHLYDCRVGTFIPQATSGQMADVLRKGFVDHLGR